MGDVGDYWRDVKAHYDSLPQQPNWTLSNTLKWLKNRVKEGSIELIEFTNGHRRVKVNGRQFDFWETGTLKDFNGEYRTWDIGDIKKMVRENLS